MHAESAQWACEEFGGADLGDLRRTARLVAMAGAAVEHPSGTVAAVFATDREREGAYDFLENEEVDPAEMLHTMRRATLRRCGELPFVFVPVDGTSISVVDRHAERDFGAIGTHAQGARGVKVIDALAVDPNGTVIGWLDLRFWTRTAKNASPPRGSYARQARPVEQKETQHWMDAIAEARTALDEHGVRGWFQIDREGDGRDLLLALDGSGHWWTVRGNIDRSIELEHGDVGKLRAMLGAHAASGSYVLQVSGRPKRSKREARMVVRVAGVTLRLRDQKTSRITPMTVHAVWAREEGTTPPGEDPIDWLLYTNRRIETLEDAQVAIYGYSQRWRVEECHRTWKAGGCDAEATQLRSFAAVQRWSIILAAVASRLERIKRLARAHGAAPASIELSAFEIHALRVLRFEGRPEDVPRDPKNIAEAVAWIAEMGGYANKYSGTPPGATVIGRGLERLQPAARLLAIQARAR
jgi:hypothetical protein